MPELDELLTHLRTLGGDTADVEVKSAGGGLPRSITETLCALANLPGGGWVILGMDERSDFQPVGLKDPQALRQGLTGKARACTPPIMIDFEQHSVHGLPVIVARVAECSASAKPCRITASGQAWLRGWDGDFTMSAVEEQAFMAQREQPRSDRAVVLGAGEADLDPGLVAVWMQTARELDGRGLGRFADQELLFRAGIVDEYGTPTKAGLLALGRHPQQFFPRYVINLSSSSDQGARAREVTTAAGPVPVMLDSALDWARRSFSRSVVAASDGTVHDSWQFPLEAFRELIGNALVHRDLDDWSAGSAIEVRLIGTRLTVSSPGGLYGISLDRLGREGTTSARNSRLIEICRYTRSDDGARVVETLASGIPRVMQTLADQELRPARFFDSGITFTALLDSADRVTIASVPMNSSEAAVFRALALGDATAAELESATGIQRPTIRKALRALAVRGMTEQDGGRGRVTVYRRTPRD